MNTLDQRQLQVHVPVVGWLLIACHALFLVIGAFVFLLLVGVGFAAGDPEATPILATVGTVVGLLLAALSVPGIVAGVGVLARKSWGRVLAIVVAILNVPNFPIGTVIGGYALWVLLQDAAAGYFVSGSRPQNGEPRPV